MSHFCATESEETGDLDVRPVPGEVVIERRAWCSGGIRPGYYGAPSALQSARRRRDLEDFGVKSAPAAPFVNALRSAVG